MFVESGSECVHQANDHGVCSKFAECREAAQRLEATRAVLQFVSPVACAEMECFLPGDLLEQISSYGLFKSSKSRNCPFVAPFDPDNGGVLHYIGTARGTRPYANPHDTGDVVVTASLNSKGCRAFVNYSGTDNWVSYGYLGGDEDPRWVAVDLGKGRLLSPTHYCLRQGGGPSSQTQGVRNWELQGSEDGVEWHTLKRHMVDSSLHNSGGLFCTSQVKDLAASWPVTSDGRGFRYFRLYSKMNIACGGIELYGVLKM
jgi:hypothetical protein